MATNERKIGLSRKSRKKYLSTGKSVKIVGVGFDVEQRNIAGFTEEAV